MLVNKLVTWYNKCKQDMSDRYDSRGWRSWDRLVEGFYTPDMIERERFVPKNKRINELRTDDFRMACIRNNRNNG